MLPPGALQAPGMKELRLPPVHPVQQQNQGHKTPHGGLGRRWGWEVWSVIR